jgi:hypothetical protein
MPTSQRPNTDGLASSSLIPAFSVITPMAVSKLAATAASSSETSSETEPESFIGSRRPTFDIDLLPEMKTVS